MMLRSIASIGAATAALLAAGAAAADASTAAYDYSAASGWDDAAAYAAGGGYVARPDWTEHGGWRFALTPYVFLPMIDGTLRYDTPPGSGNRPTVDIDTGDLFSDLNFAFMGTAEARYGRWGALLDVMYADVGADHSSVRKLTGPRGQVQIPINTGTSLDVKTWMTTFSVGAEVGHPGGRASFEPFVGVRYLTVDTDLHWSFDGPLDLFPQSGDFSQDEDIWDGIAGVRGRYNLDSKGRWQATYYVDVGAGDSDLTWQLVGGVAYNYNWGDLRFAWRAFGYDQPADKFVNDLTVNGPALGATFRF